MFCWGRIDKTNLSIMKRIGLVSNPGTLPHWDFRLFGWLAEVFRFEFQERRSCDLTGLDAAVFWGFEETDPILPNLQLPGQAKAEVPGSIATVQFTQAGRCARSLAGPCG